MDPRDLGAASKSLRESGSMGTEEEPMEPTVFLEQPKTKPKQKGQVLREGALKKWSQETGSLGEAKGMGVVWGQTKGHVVAVLVLSLVGGEGHRLGLCLAAGAGADGGCGPVLQAPNGHISGTSALRCAEPGALVDPAPGLTAQP